MDVQTPTTGRNRYADVIQMAKIAERMKAIAIASIAIGFLTSMVMLTFGGNLLGWAGVVILGVTGYSAAARSSEYGARLRTIVSESETAG